MKPYNNHVFYSEAEENFQLVLKPIVDIKKFYFETTLLETLRLRPQCNYRNLANAVTVRIALYSHERCLYFSVKNLKITPAVNLEDKDCGLTEWAQFKYSSTGNTSMYHQDHAMQPSLAVSGQNAPGPMQPAPVQPVTQSIVNRENKDASIQRWAQDIPMAPVRPVGNELQELHKPGVVAGNSASTNSKPLLHLMVPWNTDINVQRMRISQHGTPISTLMIPLFYEMNPNLDNSATGWSTIYPAWHWPSLLKVGQHCRQDLCNRSYPKYLFRIRDLVL
jgi:hypothetical protein